MAKHSIICAGIDTGKRELEVALEGGTQRLTVDNDAAGHAALSAWLKRHRVKRVGIEATGGYEGAVVAHLRGARLQVVVLQPGQVRAYAGFLLQRAKTDRIDAALIAACAAAVPTIHAPPDPRLAPLAEHLTVIEQLVEDAARLKTRRASPRSQSRIGAFWAAEIARTQALVRQELAALVAAIRRHPDLAERLALIGSVAGVGEKTAVAILLRMPEIGRVTREQAAALAGLAPYDQESGEHTGEKHIEGGRTRLRKALYAAALPAAFRWNAALVALYKRVTAKGTGHKAALIACARKLLATVNAVVARGTPWTKERAAAPPDPVSWFDREPAVSSSRPGFARDGARSRRQGWPPHPCRRRTNRKGHSLTAASTPSPSTRRGPT